MAVTEMPAAEPGLRFTHQQDVKWGDQDAFNHVNNTVYFRYIEEARVQLLLRMGMSISADRLAFLVHASLDFVRPLTYPQKIKVVLELVRIGSSSLELNTYVVQAEDEQCIYAQGRNVVVAVNSQGKTRPWSTEEIEAMQDSLSK